MLDIPRHIATLGGAAKACELLAAGATRGLIRSALRAGMVRRPRKGWYVDPSVPPAAAAAVRVGGRVTCVTALRERGVWILRHDARVHVAVHRAAGRLRSVAHPGIRQSQRPDAVVHWVATPKPRDASGSRLVEPTLRALRDAGACLTAEEFFVVAESVRALRLVSAREWAAFVRSLPRRLRRIVATAGILSGSGIESLAVYRLRRLGVRIRQQVTIGIDRVDVLVGDRLVVELDGAAFHERHGDYVRDARLAAAGFTVLRFDYGQVVDDWDAVERAVRAAVARGVHRR